MIVTTIVFVSSISGFFDLDVIFDNIEISNYPEIIGVKYNNQVKGNLSNNKTFYNQITLKMEYLDDLINVKVFANGMFQITGSKCKDKVEKLLNYIINDIFEPIKGNIIIKPNIINDYLLYNNKVIINNTNSLKNSKLNVIENQDVIYKNLNNYSLKNSKSSIIANYKPNIIYNPNEKVFSLNGIKLEMKKVNEFPILVAVKHDKMKKDVYNCHFEKIGYLIYSFKKKYLKNLRVLNCTYESKQDDNIYNIYDKYSNLIGTLTYNIDYTRLKHPNHDDIEQVSINYSGIHGNSKLNEINIKNMNGLSFIALNLNEIIDLKIFHKLISNNDNYLSIYDPTKYAGLSLIISIKNLNVIKKFKISIFSSGKILLFNLISNKDIEILENEIFGIFNKYKNKIIKNTFVRNINVSFRELTIHDIID